MREVTFLVSERCSRHNSAAAEVTSVSLLHTGQLQQIASNQSRSVLTVIMQKQIRAGFRFYNLWLYHHFWQEKVYFRFQTIPFDTDKKSLYFISWNLSYYFFFNNLQWPENTIKIIIWRLAIWTKSIPTFDRDIVWLPYLCHAGTLCHVFHEDLDPTPADHG